MRPLKLAASALAAAVLSGCGTSPHATVTVDPQHVTVSPALRRELVAAGTAYKIRTDGPSIKEGDYTGLVGAVAAHDSTTHITWVVATLVPRAGAEAAAVAEQDAGGTQSFQRVDGSTTWVVTDIGSAGGCHPYGRNGFPPLAVARLWHWHTDNATCGNPD